MLPMSTMNIMLTLLISLMTILVLLYTNPKLLKTEEMKKKEFKKTTILSLFTSFDPKTSIMEELNWMCFLIPTIFLLYSMWTKPSRFIWIKNNIISNIEKQLQIALKTKKDNSSNLFITLFLILMTCNLMGLMPNLFTGTSHISVNMMIAVPMWVGFMLYGWINFTNKMFAHLVPSGTPLALINFMVLIEMISNTIRPLTLSIRLMANMVSGHLLLTLMGNMMNNSSYTLCFMMIFVQMILSSLELGVALIQAYVFCMLMTLYSDDSDYNN